MKLKWIKLAVEIFDNRKIKQIESLPDGDGLIVIWLKLLCLAASVNDNGWVYFTPDIPYTEQMLATQFGRPLELVQTALAVFEQFKMTETNEEGFLRITNWSKYQSAEEKPKPVPDAREQVRQRVAKFRENKRMAAKNTGSVYSNADLTQSNAFLTHNDALKTCENAKNVTCNADVTPCNVTCNADVTPCNVTCNADVTPCNVTCNANVTPYKEKEREKEGDINNNININNNTQSKYIHIVTGSAGGRYLSDEGTNGRKENAHVPWSKPEECRPAYGNITPRRDTPEPPKNADIPPCAGADTRTSLNEAQTECSDKPAKTRRLSQDELFEQVWSKYPTKRKQGKERARRAFRDALRRGVDPKTIADGIEAYKRYIDLNSLNPQYVKQGGSWFEQRAWQDDYPSEPFKAPEQRKEKPEKPKNKALNYAQKQYSHEDLRAMGLDFGEDIYADDYKLSSAAT